MFIVFFTVEILIFSCFFVLVLFFLFSFDLTAVGTVLLIS